MDITLTSPGIKKYVKLEQKPSYHDVYMHQVQKQQHNVHARTFIDHMCNLDIDRDPEFVRQSNIVCTLGNLWDSDEKIIGMIKEGMNILRLNLSMGSHEYFEGVIQRVRAIEESLGYNPCVAIAVDLSTPPVRTGLINSDVDASLTLKDGQFVKLTVEEAWKEKSCSECIWVDSQYFKSCLLCVAPGDFVHLDDGMISLVVKDVGCNSVNCLVLQGGELGSCRRVQLPAKKIYEKTFDTTYKDDLLFAVKTGVDFVFTGYARNGAQLVAARKILDEHIQLYAKVGSKDAFANLKELLEVADGIIVDRGELGLDFPSEKIFQFQKHIIAKCNILHKPVFVIAQLLDSMRFKPRATRAEISDVANAVLDGADGLILTVETSRGLFPKEALRIMHKTCREAEGAIFHEQYWRDLKFIRESHGLLPLDPSYITALAAVKASSSSIASVIFVITTTGRSAMSIASFRPCCPVVAIMRRPKIARACHSIRGVHPYVYLGEKLTDWSEDMDHRINAGVQFARTRGFVQDGDQIVIVTGWEAGTGSTNTVRVFQLPPASSPLCVVNSASQMRGIIWDD